jgi:hypothetical protein
VAGFFLSSEQTVRYYLVILFFRIFDEIIILIIYVRVITLTISPNPLKLSSRVSKYAYQAQEKQAADRHCQRSKDVFKGEL